MDGPKNYRYGREPSRRRTGWERVFLVHLGLGECSCRTKRRAKDSKAETGEAREAREARIGGSRQLLKYAQVFICQEIAAFCLAVLPLSQGPLKRRKRRRLSSSARASRHWAERGRGTRITQRSLTKPDRDAPAVVAAGSAEWKVGISPARKLHSS